MTNDGIRELTQQDLDWVLDLSHRRRARIAPFAPRFWNPAPDAREVHATFLGNKIDNPDVLTIRTDHGFLFGYPGPDRLDIDDMALDAESRWPDDGIALLQRAGSLAALNVVCPVPEPERRSAVEAVGLAVAESWWTKDLTPAADPEPPADDPKITAADASGVLVPAPPVYAPGGPVLLASNLGRDSGNPTGDALAELEQAAAAAGAVVAVVPQPADDTARAALLSRHGYLRTSDFHRGRTSTGQ